MPHHLFVFLRMAICGIILNLIFLKPVFAESVPLFRSFPYPFGHSISFASDVDMQKPSHGAGIHRVFNEELGLTISDSLWPHGGNITSSSLFLGPDQVNRTPSGLGSIPTFALLLREWHRGNIDHFHSWQDDSAVPLRNNFVPHIKLSKLKTSITLPKLIAPILGQRVQNLRLYFSSQPPKDLRVILIEKGGRSASFSIGSAEGTVQLKEGNMEWIKEILIPVDDLPFGGGVKLDPLLIEKIDLIAPSCTGGCSVALTRLERDHFSRRTVLSQLPYLEAWNIRPALLTSHGGNSLAQNFGSIDKVLDLPRTAGTIYSDPAVVVRLEALANVKARHAYHADLLTRLGILGVWPYFGSRVHTPLNSSLGKSNLSMVSPYDGLYEVSRSMPPVIDLSSRENFLRDAKRVYPDMSATEISSLYCGPACNVDQGNAIPHLIAHSMQVINRSNDIARGLFYTHFGSGAGVSKVTGTYEKPITDETYSAMRKFSNYVFNFDGSIPLSKRIWSPPATSWLRYEILQAGIAENIRISQDGNLVTITPWIDPITKKTIPDLNAGARDLHGLTIYVDEPEKTRIIADKRELKAIVRNPPDQTGRASITLVDDNTPTSIIDGVALSRRGTVTVREGEFLDVAPHDGDKSFLKLVAGSKGKAEIVFKPNRLELWNTTHIFSETRKRELLDKVSPGRFTIKILMNDGGLIVYTEEPKSRESIGNASYWYVPANSVSNDWLTNTLDVAQLDFPRSIWLEKNKRPALPIGRVREIHMQLDGAAPGDTLEIAKLFALRPNGNDESPDGTKLVSGRVTIDGTLPLQRISVYARKVGGGKTTTVTDSDGYYFFYGQSRGGVLTIVAENENVFCFPSQGRDIQIMKNEVELDIICPPRNFSTLKSRRM
jgi:hypothetical protein